MIGTIWYAQSVVSLSKWIDIREGSDLLYSYPLTEKQVIILVKILDDLKGLQQYE